MVFRLKYTKTYQINVLILRIDLKICFILLLVSIDAEKNALVSRACALEMQ